MANECVHARLKAYEAEKAAIKLHIKALRAFLKAEKASKTKNWVTGENWSISWSPDKPGKVTRTRRVKK